MRRAMAVLLAFTLLGCSCGAHSPQQPATESHLQVYVHWEAMGLAGKQIQVLELQTEKLTDSTGVAVFNIPAGQYTVRAYGINTGGPPPPYVERGVATTGGQTTTVDIVDCLPCVAELLDH